MTRHLLAPVLLCSLLGLGVPLGVLHAEPAAQVEVALTSSEASTSSRRATTDRR